MFLALMKIICALIGERWTEVSLPNSFGLYLVFRRSGAAVAIVLWHRPGYERSSLADSKGHLRINLRGGTWPKILEFARSKGEAQPPRDYFFDRQRDRVFYSLDGETFSIPASVIEEIEKQIAVID